MKYEQAVALVQLAEQLESGEVEEYLASALLNSVQARAWLDKRYPPDLSIAILECASCRQHFCQKFQEASRWLLTRQAAEQASDSRIASWRASYLSRRLPIEAKLVEVGTGIGGDSVFLRRHFEVEGYEADPARAYLALENTRRLSPDGKPITIYSKSAEIAELSGALLFCDPSRRTHQRLYNPRDWSPPLPSVLFHPRFSHRVIKAAPGIDLNDLPVNVEVHFLSLDGHLKEAMLINLARSEDSPTRHAWLWLAGQKAPLHFSNSGYNSELADLGAKPQAENPSAGSYLYNPDPAIVRAGLLKFLARKLNALPVHPKIGYLCAPIPSSSPWITCFRIIECMPLNWERLISALKASSWGDFEYLSRGVPFAQDEVLKRTAKARKLMKGRSRQRGSLIVWRGEKGYLAALGERESDPSLGSFSP